MSGLEGKETLYSSGPKKGGGYEKPAPGRVKEGRRGGSTEIVDGKPRHTKSYFASSAVYTTPGTLQYTPEQQQYQVALTYYFDRTTSTQAHA